MILRVKNPRTAITTSYNRPVFYNNIVLLKGIRTRGPDNNLENEAKRIISLLPKIKPGKENGVRVRVPFSIPITFKLQ